MNFIFKVDAGFRFVLTAVCVALLSPACRPPIHHRNDTLIVALDTSPTSLDPRIGIDKVSENFHRLLFNGLMQKDEQDRMVPDLAVAVEKLGPTRIRFRLRENVRFHDGRSLTARDVVYTYRSILNGEVMTVKKAALELISDIREISPHEVEIQLKSPFNGLFANLNIGIVPENAPPDFARHPVGTGPYRFVSYEHDETAVLEAFPGYFDGAPRIRRLQIRIIPDATTRALELRKGAVDLVFGPAILPYDSFRVLRNSGKLAVMTAPGNNYAYLGLNLRDPILSDHRVREALALGIDRKELIDNLFYGAAAPATGILGPHHWAYEKNVLQISYDPDRARRLLDEAGYRDPDGDGPQMRFRLDYKISTSEFRRMIAQILQSHLARIGIGIDIRSYEWGTFFSDVNHGNFQMCMLMWVGESDPDIFRIAFSTDGPRNRGKYSNPDVDQWIKQAASVETETQQKELYALIQKQIAEDFPYISLWYEWNMAVFRKELAGLKLTPDADYRVLKNVYWKD